MPKKPDPKRWLHDRRLTADGRLLLGVDEVGRGCLAGPVVAASVQLDQAFFASRTRRSVCLEMRDSKQLSAERREALSAQMHVWRDKCLLNFAIAEGSVAEIEQLNILEANTLAMRRTLEKLLPEGADWKSENAPRILIDGRPVKRLGFPHEAIVKGDDISLVIAMASILAKVYRDHLMTHACATYSAYQFSQNKGYGSETHRAALQEIGPCPLHRMSFLQKILSDPASNLQPELPL